MNKVIRGAGASIVLFLFLLPLIGTELHAISHLNDVHCLANDVHFHQTEHHCQLCDFLLPASISPGQLNKDFTHLLCSSAVIIFHHIESGFSAPEFFFSLRGPPYSS